MPKFNFFLPTACEAVIVEYEFVQGEPDWGVPNDYEFTVYDELGKDITDELGQDWDKVYWACKSDWLAVEQYKGKL